ncbi:hypothetical protein RND81_10G233400 [Saponaria officinalis]|uniref:Uncharacterized protein n=1 Tax=Saponaria officinalis TaxID=3572 RepID=A0AAW1I6I7_SAPOF
MIADPISIPACFSLGDRSLDDPTTTSVTRSGQHVIMSTYKTNLHNQTRFITITWCRNLLLLQHGLSVSISNLSGHESGSPEYTCKVEMKPWYFWRKHGSKRFVIDNDEKIMDVFWDFRSAKFNNGETEPSSDYYIAVLHENEIVLLVGDLRNEACKKTGSRPGLFYPTLVYKKEHVFGKRRFVFSKVKFHENDKFHDIVISCNNNNNINNKINKNNNNNGSGHEMEVRVNGQIVINVKHLEWKFRGNECIHVNKLRVEVYWDVHDWLFSNGLRNALFIFKPIIPPSMLPSSSSLSLSLSLSSPASSSSTGSSGSIAADGLTENGSSEFCLFLYAWKVE